jgi:hypothetical protein
MLVFAGAAMERSLLISRHLSQTNELAGMKKAVA